ncbi:hypothetical protein EIP91_007732 [Steccherinum ochraceum]|uniref:Uncharacterized protein n=1 Tax=Steccherinum ochraceum TaxID=92696 RepID=A0A4R0RSS5_9APHY|nr:hypothetical protein EIP91_007732 [Steccherinum ochraceum]
MGHDHRYRRHSSACNTSLVSFVDSRTATFLRCKGQIITEDILETLGVFGTAAFATLRTWAVWQRAPIPTVLVFLTSAVVPAVYIYTYSFTQDFIVEGSNCMADIPLDDAQLARATVASTSDVVSYISRVAAIISDLLLLAFTWAKTADVWRKSSKMTQSRPSLTTVLLRDGTQYFVMLVIMSIVALFLNAFQKQTNDGTAFSNTILNGISANLIARFILDLRSVYEEGSRVTGTTVISSVRFNVHSLAGNMGAPLGIEDSTWVSGPTDDVADNHDEKYEEAAIPFHAGLELDAEMPMDNVVPGDGNEHSNFRRTFFVDSGHENSTTQEVVAIDYDAPSSDVV